METDICEAFSSIAHNDDQFELNFDDPDDATSGSVIRKAERISPSISGLSHWAFCSPVP